MKNQGIHIDELFLKGLGNYTEVPPADVWVALENRLNGSQGNRKPIIWWWFVLVLMLAVGGGVYFGKDITRKFTSGSNTVPVTTSNTNTTTNSTSNNEPNNTATIPVPISEKNKSINREDISPDKKDQNKNIVSALPAKKHKQHNTSVKTNTEHNPPDTISKQSNTSITSATKTIPHKKDHTHLTIPGTNNTNTVANIKKNTPVLKKQEQKKDTTLTGNTTAATPVYNAKPNIPKPKKENIATNKNKRRPITTTNNTAKKNNPVIITELTKKQIADTNANEVKNPPVVKAEDNKPKHQKTGKPIDNTKKLLRIASNKNLIKKPIKPAIVANPIKKPVVAKIADNTKKNNFSSTTSFNNKKTTTPKEFTDAGKFNKNKKNNGANKQAAKKKIITPAIPDNKAIITQPDNTIVKTVIPTEDKTSNTITPPTTTTDNTFKPDKIEDVFAANNNRAKGIPIDQGSNTYNKEDIEDTPPADNLPGGTTTSGGGGGGGSSDYKPKKSVLFEGGAKVAYSFGAQAFSFSSGVFSAYLQYNFSDNFQIVIQPGLRINSIGNDPFKGPDIYFTNLNAIVGSPTQVGPYNISNFTQTYDSISKMHSLTSKTAYEFEIPILLKPKLAQNLYLIGGPVFTIGKITSITNTSGLVHATYSGTDSSNFPAILTRIDINNKYHNSSPYYLYDSSQYQNPTVNTIRLGIMLGLSTTIKQRLVLDFTVQQNLSNNSFIPNTTIRTLYSQPYIRITIGYKLF